MTCHMVSRQKYGWCCRYIRTDEVRWNEWYLGRFQFMHLKRVRIPKSLNDALPRDPTALVDT